MIQVKNRRSILISIFNATIDTSSLTLTFINTVAAYHYKWLLLWNTKFSYKNRSFVCINLILIKFDKKTSQYSFVPCIIYKIIAICIKQQKMDHINDMFYCTKQKETVDNEWVTAIGSNEKIDVRYVHFHIYYLQLYVYCIK